jgi:hypothetical protein
VYFELLNIEICGNISFAFNSDQNNHILIACETINIMESKDELVFVDFFLHPIPNITYAMDFIHLFPPPTPPKPFIHGMS